MKTEDERIFEMTKEIFIKRAPSEFFNEKSLPGYEATLKNAMRIAEFFVKEFYKEKE